MMSIELPAEHVQTIMVTEAYRLMGLGAPTKKDDQGFNKPDWSKMSYLLPSVELHGKANIDPKVYAFVANTLVKYVRQIPDPQYTWIKNYAKTNPSYDSYYALKRNIGYDTVAGKMNRNKKALAAELVGLYVEVQFPYDPAVVKAVRSIPGVRHRREGEGYNQSYIWMIPLASAEAAKAILEPVIDSDALAEVIEANDQIFANIEKATAPGTIKIGAKEDAGFLRLSFRKDFRIIKAIKSLPDKAYDGGTYEWIIPQICAEDLVFQLDGYNDIDISELRPFAVEEKEEGEDPYEMDLAPYGNLFDHQKTGINFLANPSNKAMLKGRILADDMGLGKTRQAVVAAHTIMQREGGKALLVVPASLRLNWEREIKMVFPAAQIYIVRNSGPMAGWLEDEVEECDWIIINYDLLKRFEDNIVVEDWAVCIADEAHFIKNLTSLRSRIMHGYTPQNSDEGKSHLGILNLTKKNILLTGTPITSRPLDMFSLLKGIGHPLGLSYKTFILRYCDAKKTSYGWDAKGASNLAELHRKTKSAILRRNKEECLDLPEKIRAVVPVEIDLSEYKGYWEEYKQKLAEEGRILQSEHLAMMTKLRQAAAIGKIPITIEMAEDAIENGEKIIIFTCFTEVAQKLMAHFGEVAVKVVGGMTDAQKQKSVDDFQNDPKKKVFVGNIKAASVGLTLTAARNVHFNDYSFVPTDHLQAEDRAYRIGQKNAVTVTYTNAVDTIDEEVSVLLARKLEIISKVIEGKEVSDNDIFGELVEMLFGAGSMIRGR